MGRTGPRRAPKAGRTGGGSECGRKPAGRRAAGGAGDRSSERRRRGILPELHSSRSPGSRSGRHRRSPGGGARPGTGWRSRAESRSSFRSSFRSSLRSPFPVAVRSSEAPARRIPGNLRNPRKFPENSPERAAPRPGARPGSPPPSAPVVLKIGPGPDSLDRFPGRGREASERPTLARGRAARIETPGPRGSQPAGGPLPVREHLREGGRGRRHHRISSRGFPGPGDRYRASGPGRPHPRRCPRRTKRERPAPERRRMEPGARRPGSAADDSSTVTPSMMTPRR